MLTDLQNQFEFYFHGDSKSNNPQKAPERWEETVFVEPDISNDDIQEYLK
jgi:hypothetical protein